MLVTANVAPSSTILVILMMEALSSSETPVLARATRRNIPEDAFLLLHAVKFSSNKLTSSIIITNLRYIRPMFCYFEWNGTNPTVTEASYSLWSTIMIRTLSYKPEGIGFE
jgi:hypothetical protein